jgi:hypothetical protein
LVALFYIFSSVGDVKIKKERERGGRKKLLALTFTVGDNASKVRRVLY